MSSTRNFIYKFLNEWQSDLKHRTLGSEEILRKSENCVGAQRSAQYPLQK